jgi:hypothetical protein
MNAIERADSIIKDILDNHLPRVIEGLSQAGYVDENQVLVIYDHAVRARILKEFAEAKPALEEMDNLGKLIASLKKSGGRRCWRSRSRSRARPRATSRDGQRADAGHSVWRAHPG